MTTATSMDELVTGKDLIKISGLEFMQRMLAGTLPRPPISVGLNYQVYTVEDGKVVFRGTPEFDHCNPMGTVHGGWYGTLLDSCMACAVMTKVPQGSVYTTLEYKVNIVRPILPGTEVEAIGVTQHSGRSTGVASGELRGVTDGRLYATGSTTCIIMKLA